jgi:hypothetical protein
MVAMAWRGDHRSYADVHVPRRFTPAKWLNGAIDGSRKQYWSPEMRKLTVNLLVWSATTIAAGDDGD